MRKEGALFFGFILLIFSLANVIGYETKLCEPMDIMLVVDTSGSMTFSMENGMTRLETSYVGVSNLINQVSGDIPNIHRISLVIFGGFSDDDPLLGSLPDARLIFPFTLLPTNPSDYLITKYISQEPKITGMTNMYEGMELALKEFSDHPRSVKKIIIFLGDGGHTEEGNPLDLATQAKLAGITIYTIGVGVEDSEAETTLISMASSPGHYYSVPTGQLSNLPDVYEQIASSISCECGDNKIHILLGEVCDGTALGTYTACSAYNSVFLPDVGTLKCNSTCTGWDVSGCKSASNPTITLTAPVDGQKYEVSSIVNFQANSLSSIPVDGITMGNIVEWLVRWRDTATGTVYSRTFLRPSGSTSINENIDIPNNGIYKVNISGKNNYGLWATSADRTINVSLTQERLWVRNVGGWPEVSSVQVGDTLRMVMTRRPAGGSYSFQIFSDSTLVRTISASNSGTNLTALWTISADDYSNIVNPSNVHFVINGGNSGPLNVILPPSEMFWEDSGQHKITETSSTSTVRLVKTNTGLKPGLTANMEIYERDAPLVFDTITTLPGTVNNSGALIATWNIGTADLSATIDYNNFTFKVGSDYSNELKIIFPPEFSWRNWSDETKIRSSATVGENISIYILHSGLSAGPADVEIWEEDPSENDPIRTSGKNGVISGVVDSLGTFRAEMKINNSDWENGNDPESDETLEFFFRVGALTSLGKTNGILSVTNPSIDPNSYWASDSAGVNKIDQAQTGQTIYLILNNSGLIYTGSPITKTFTIKEEDDGFLDPLDDDITSLTGELKSDGLLVAEWTISEQNLIDGDDGDGTTEYYFYVEGYESIDSGHLNISLDSTDDPFEVEIVSPPCGSNFSVGDVFSIVLDADDPDDEYSVTVRILRNEVTEVFNSYYEKNDFSSGPITILSSSFVTSEGTYKISIEGINSDAENSRAIINVIITNSAVPGRYVAACIDEPKNYAFVEPDAMGIIKFNASSTKGVEVSSGIVNPIEKKDMLFNWQFSDLDEYGYRDNPYHDGENLTSYEFYKIFVPVDENWGTLEVLLKP